MMYLSVTNIYDVLNCNKIDKRENDSITINTNKPTPVVMYDLEFNPIRSFDSMMSVYRWLNENTEFKVTTQAVYSYIKIACKNGNISYGHRWQYLEDLEYDNKLFRTIFDIEEYKEQGHKNAYKPNGKQYYIMDNALDNVKTIKSSMSNIENVKEYTCIQCGKTVNKIYMGNLCASCCNVKAKGKIQKPSKEQLIQDLKYLKVKDVAAKYGRTVSTVCYWKKQYDIE